MKVTEKEDVKNQITFTELKIRSNIMEEKRLKSVKDKSILGGNRSESSLELERIRDSLPPGKFRSFVLKKKKVIGKNMKSIRYISIPDKKKIEKKKKRMRNKRVQVSNLKGGNGEEEVKEQKKAMKVKIMINSGNQNPPVSSLQRMGSTEKQGQRSKETHGLSKFSKFMKVTKKTFKSSDKRRHRKSVYYFSSKAQHAKFSSFAKKRFNSETEFEDSKEENPETKQGNMTREQMIEFLKTQNKEDIQQEEDKKLKLLDEEENKTGLKRSLELDDYNSDVSPDEDDNSSIDFGIVLEDENDLQKLQNAVEFFTKNEIEPDELKDEFSKLRKEIDVLKSLNIDLKRRCVMMYEELSNLKVKFKKFTELHRDCNISEDIQQILRIQKKKLKKKGNLDYKDLNKIAKGIVSRSKLIDNLENKVKSSYSNKALVKKLHKIMNEHLQTVKKILKLEKIENEGLLFPQGQHPRPLLFPKPDQKWGPEADDSANSKLFEDARNPESEAILHAPWNRRVQISHPE